MLNLNLILLVKSLKKVSLPDFLEERRRNEREKERKRDNKMEKERKKIGEREKRYNERKGEIRKEGKKT
jgi:hypothetical protein